MKKRNEIEEKYKWDLSSLYASDESWEKEYNKLNENIKKYDEYTNDFLSSKERFFEFLEFSLEGSRKLSRLYTYAKMKLDEDASISKYQGYFSKIQGMSVLASEKTAFFVPDVIENSDVVNEYIKGSIYEKYIGNILRNKEHTLSKKEEKILALTGKIASNPHDVYNMLTNVDLKFPDVVIDGKNEPLSAGTFIKYLQNDDREIRKQAYDKYYQRIKDFRNTFAGLITGEVNKNCLYASVKNFSSPRAAALFSNNVDEKVYDNLLESIHGNLDVLHKYMKIRKEILNLDKLHGYDLYTPLVKDYEDHIPYEEAKDILLDAIDVLGEDYKSTVKGAFDESWIDVYQTENKRSGAYSFGSYDSKPYILLNHKDDLSSLFTLAHEMGHSMHSYYTRKNQPYVYGNYSIFIAEVASTTNESLLNYHLTETSTDNKKKLFLLNNYIERFRATLFRQTLFAEFEMIIHDKVFNGSSLTADDLSEIYGDLNKKYYGDDFVVDDYIKHEWARIPHFYYNFYVFQYATGFSAAVKIADNIIKDSNYKKKYKDFLSAGSSVYPIDALKLADIDMTKKDVVDSALKIFSSLVGELENCYKEELCQ